MYQSNTGGARQVVGTGLAVGAIQLGIGVAMLTAFTGGAVQKFFPRTLDTRQYTNVPPPPPPPGPVVHDKAHHEATATTDQHSIIAGAVGSLTIIPGPIDPLPPSGGGDGIKPEPIPTSPPTPPLAIVGAHPLGDTGAWITPDDYPYRALREGWRGTTRLHLNIDAGGHVTNCTVTASSGHEALDAVACAKVTQRAKFSPARDGTGKPHDGGYDNAIHWQIHEEAF